jgi:hypothetical protein
LGVAPQESPPGGVRPAPRSDPSPPRLQSGSNPAPTAVVGPRADLLIKQSDLVD